MPSPPRPPRSVRLAAALALSLGVARPAGGTTLVARPLDAMIRDADAVALVTAPATLAARPRWVDGRIVTDVDLSVVEVLRGELAVGPLTLRLPGGTVGDVTQRLAGAPAFTPGGAWVVLLRRTPDGAYTVFDLCLGQLPVALDPTTRAPTVRPAPTADVTLVPDPRAAAAVASTGLAALPPEGLALARFAALVHGLDR